MPCADCLLNGSMKLVNKGSTKSGIVIIGDSPSYQDALTKTLFTSTQGKVLDKCLRILNLTRSDVVLANAVKCYISDGASRTYISSGVSNCRDYLFDTLQKIKPKLVILLGNLALRQVLKKTGALKHHGTFTYSTELGCTVFATVSPSYCVNNSQKAYPDIPDEKMSMRESIIFNDFKTVLTWLETGASDIDTSNYTEILSDQDISDLTKDKRIIAFDLEWNTDTGEILTISFTSEAGKSKIYSFVTQAVPFVIKRLLEDSSISKIVAARPIDEMMLRKLHITVQGKIFDVLTAAHIIDENYYTYSLEDVSNHYTALHNIKQLSRNKRGSLQDLDKTDLIAYSGVDSDATYRSFLAIHTKLKETPALYKYYYKFIAPAQDLFTKMQENGCLIDTKKLKENSEFASTLLTELHTTCLGMIPEHIKESYKDNLSLTRNALLVDYLFTNKAGKRLRAASFTETTNVPAITEAHLKQFIDDPFISTYLRWKKLAKITSSYINNMWEFIDPVTKKIHPQTLINRTVTGRTTCYKPAIQTFPQRGEFVNLIRDTIVSPPGWVLGCRDLSQSEVRIMGWLAQDPNILNALQQKIDIHTKTAATINSIDISQVTKEMRQKSKGAVFGFLYGMSAESFVTYAKDTYNLTFTLDEAINARNKFFSSPNGYYKLPVYHAKMKALAYQQGYVESPLGRRRRLHNIHSDNSFERGGAERQAINFPIQSFSSDLGIIGCMLMQKDIEVNHLENKIQLLFFIHDAIIFQAKTDFFDIAMAMLKDCMEVRVKDYIKQEFGVAVTYPIESEGKYGTSWGDLKTYTMDMK